MRNYIGILPLAAATALVSVAAHGSAAHAAEEVLLTTDQSQVFILPEQPYTVVVGNPAIADVSTDGNSLYLHPKGFGVTNVLVSNLEGKTLADYLVRVIFQDSYSVSMYSPDGRMTFDCKTDCERILRVGDNSGFFNDYKNQAGDKNSLAANQALGEDLLMQSQQNSGYAAR